jgi:PiT family inorganic phosphate transporter
MNLFGETLPMATAIFLLLALLMALCFEFVNGFHDTANAVATVIYTHSLPPVIAVIWSGLWNLIGVLVSSGAVAFSILALLPVELVLNVGSGAGFAMVFALLISAIAWNVGTLVSRVARFQLAYAHRVDYGRRASKCLDKFAGP